jgi:hypothetical protein
MQLRFTIYAAFLLGATLSAFSANAADMIQVIIENDDLQDVFVSVYDANTQNNQPILSGERINFHASKTINITADGNGHGHVGWVAKRASGSDGCGNGESKDLNNGDTVSVVAKDQCTDALSKKAMGKKAPK